MVSLTLNAVGEDSTEDEEFGGDEMLQMKLFLASF
jgi:hypothetical protein